MWNLSIAFLKASSDSPITMIFGEKYGAETDQETHNTGISFTERKVVSGQ
jgi:hypothetical protein